MCSDMGANASVLQLSHWEELPTDVLHGCVAHLEGQVEKGTSWPHVSRVCKDWRRVAGNGSRLCFETDAVG